MPAKMNPQRIRPIRASGLSSGFSTRTCGSSAARDALLPRLGFLISFPVMIVLTSAGGSEFTWRDALLNALILTVMSYAVFIYGLQLTIPLWPTLG